MVNTEFKPNPNIIRKNKGWAKLPIILDLLLK
jgi:hypothetical protein